MINKVAYLLNLANEFNKESKNSYIFPSIDFETGEVRKDVLSFNTKEVKYYKQKVQINNTFRHYEYIRVLRFDNLLFFADVIRFGINTVKEPSKYELEKDGTTKEIFFFKNNDKITLESTIYNAYNFGKIIFLEKYKDSTKEEFESKLSSAIERLELNFKTLPDFGKVNIKDFIN